MDLTAFLGVDWTRTLALLAHVLVFVYWLGGDLGAFAASHIVTRVHEPTPARIAAARILADVDMAPRTALILAAPTGFTLAVLSGWVVAPAAALLMLWGAAMAWLALAWWLHLSHAKPGSLWRRLDLVTRWLVLFALIAWAVGVFGALPIFLQIKAVLLALAIGLGLMIRARLGPFGPAFAALIASNGADAVANVTIAKCIAGARPLVIGIWLCLLVAALLGLAKPQ